MKLTPSYRQCRRSPSYKGQVFPLCLALWIKTYRDVHELVFLLQRSVQGNVPLAHPRKLLYPLFYKLHRVAGIENIAAAELPCVNQPSRGAAVETLDFQVSHLVNVAFMELEQVANSRVRIIKFRFRFDRCGHVSTRAIELLDLIEVLRELDGIGGLPELLMDKSPELLSFESFVA